MYDSLCKIVNVVTAVGSLHLGLQAVGYDLPMMLGRGDLGHVLGYVFGIAGVASIVMLFTCKHKCHM